MEDGTRLAARLFLPDELPAPVVLDALPYRMDDLTASYASEYERLCEEGGFAVCRLDLRGTGSSEGIAIDEYHPQEQADICEAIAWLAVAGVVHRQGRHVRNVVGRLQLAAGRDGAPAGAARDRPDLRDRRPLHRRRPLHGRNPEGDRPRRLRALHRRLQRPAPRPCGLRRRLARGVAPPHRRDRAVAPALARGARRRAVLAARFAPAWIRPHHLPDDDRRGLGGRLHEHRASSLRGAVVPTPRDHRPVEPHVDRRRRYPARTSTSCPSSSAGSLAGCATSATGSTRSRRSPCSCAARRARRRISRRCAASGARSPPGRPSGCRPRCGCPRDDELDRIVVRGDVGTAAWISCAGKPPWTLPDDQREDDAASLTYEWAPLDDELELLGHPRLRLTVTSPHPVAFLSARLCDVFPDGASALVSRGVLNLTHRGGHTDAAAARARCPDPGGARARVDILDLRARPSRAPGAGRIGLAEHVAASAWQARSRCERATVELELPVLDGSARRTTRRSSSHLLPRDPRARTTSRSRLSCGASSATSSAARRAS